MKRTRQLRRSALGLRPAQVFVEPGHDLDEIAGPRAVVELRGQNAVPAVAAGAGRAKQASLALGNDRTPNDLPSILVLLIGVVQIARVGQHAVKLAKTRKSHR